MKKLKKIIPNILTLLRLIVTPFIIYLGINNRYKLLTIICVIISLTDFIDGKLARKWDCCTEFGARLDAICDKTFAIGLLIILILKNHIFLYLLTFELLITILNIFIFIKTKAVESLLIGKLKTWILFLALILGLVNVFFPKIHIVMNIFIFLSIVFQLLTFIFYVKNYFSLEGKKKI